MNQICYVITIAKNFPATHPKAGEPTGFYKKIGDGNKIHTIRANYELWKERFKKIDRGEAYISIREWTGKPYASKQKELFRRDTTDGISLEKLEYKDGRIIIDDEYNTDQDIKEVVKNLAYHDGLSEKDFMAWFGGSLETFNKPFAIINLTESRYTLPF